MKKSWALALFAGLLLPSLALAHGPSRQKVRIEREINAPAETVWAVAGDFAKLDQWLPPVSKSEIISGENNTAGAVRAVTVGDVVLEETIKSIDNAKMVLKYKITKGDVNVLPVNNYSSVLKVAPAGEGKSVVSWQGAFYRGYPNNDPPPELNDEAAIKAVTGLYNLGLDNLKAVIEGQ